MEEIESDVAILEAALQVLQRQISTRNEIPSIEPLEPARIFATAAAIAAQMLDAYNDKLNIPQSYSTKEHQEFQKLQDALRILKRQCGNVAAKPYKFRKINELPNN